MIFSLSRIGRVHCSNVGIKCCDKKIRNLFTASVNIAAGFWNVNAMKD